MRRVDLPWIGTAAELLGYELLAGGDAKPELCETAVRVRAMTITACSPPKIRPVLRFFDRGLLSPIQL